MVLQAPLVAKSVERGIPLVIRMDHPACYSVYIDGALYDMFNSSVIRIMTHRLKGGNHTLEIRRNSDCAPGGTLVLRADFYVIDEAENNFFLKFKPGEVTTIIFSAVSLLVVAFPVVEKVRSKRISQRLY